MDWLHQLGPLAQTRIALMAAMATYVVIIAIWARMTD